jgi:nitronate monooxygenase
VTAIRRRLPVPVIAAGGLMTGDRRGRRHRAGAAAAQLGTALLRCPESGASEVHKSALSDPAFHENDDHPGLQRSAGPRARERLHEGPPRRPVRLPQINNATRALRREAVARHNPHAVNLWAGQGYRLARDRPAAEIVAAIGSESRRLISEGGRPDGLPT